MRLDTITPSGSATQALEPRPACFDMETASRTARPPRALLATPAFWFAMFAASAFGTNLGDFWVDDTGLSRGASLSSLLAISLAGVFFHRRFGSYLEAGYWVAIIALRAAATNLADYLTHDLEFSYVGLSLAFGAATLATGLFTVIDPSRRTAPRVDSWYWMAMLIAGICGTVAGDLTSHHVGLFLSAASLSSLLLLVLVLRGSLGAISVLSYWVAIILERCAGTPVGDVLAERDGFGLGLPLALMCTGGGLAFALMCRWALNARRG